MLFNSLAFLLFFPIVVLLYWILPHRYRNLMLLVASYYFYMNWEPIYALLILGSTVVTYLCSLGIDKTQGKYRKTYIYIGLGLNLGVLFLYKYLNFATASVYGFLDWCGLRMEVPHFDLLLPVGISFYTFQALGYMIDVYRKDIPVERSFWKYALFVSFFPQLVAGPIERAKNLLLQFNPVHKFNGDWLIEGLKLMIWGYFMKLCIAENVAPYVDAVYNNAMMHNGTSMILATFFFTFQIFCDFGGYSLIAIGTAKCMGFTLMMNFNRPYLSTSIKEFWRRWHISLSTWFSDYVYIPLGGSRCTLIKHLRNLLITFLISGLWHGADWTFVAWGGLYGVILCFEVLKKKYIPIKFRGKIMTVGKVLFTFALAMLGWVFFRANSMSDAIHILQSMFTDIGGLYNGEGMPQILMCMCLIALLMFKEIKDELKWSIHFMHSKSQVVSVVSTAMMIVLILLCAEFESGQFIYFQF